MRVIGKRALVILGSSLFGSTLWLASFAAVIIGSARLKEPGVIEDALVAGGGFIMAGTLGIVGAVCMLRRFWRTMLSK